MIASGRERSDRLSAARQGHSHRGNVRMGPMFLKLLKRAGWVTAGNVVGQALVLVSTLWLARMYSPSEFGIFALIIIVSNISVALSNLRFDVAIPSSSENEYLGLTALAVFSNVFSASIVTLSLVVSNEIGIISSELVKNSSPLIFATILTSGSFQTLSAKLVREEKFRLLGLIRGAQGLAFVAFASIPAVGLLWAQALSLAWGLAIFPVALKAVQQLGFRNIASLLRRQWKLPLFSLPGAALDVIGYSMVVWVLMSAYGASEAGTYSQLQRLLGGPLMLISISLGQVLLRQTVDHAGDPELMHSLLSKVLFGMIGLLVLVLIAVLIAGAPVLEAILGDQWVVDPMMAVFITIAVGVRACISPLSSALITLRRFGVVLTWQVIYFSSAVILFPLMAARLEFKSYVVFYALHELVLYTLYLALIWWSISRKEAL